MLFLFFGVAAFRLQSAALAAVFTPVLLTTTGIVPVLDNVLAAAVSTGVYDEFGYHHYTVPDITSN